MDFTPSEAQRELAALTRLILADEPRALWKELGAAGVLGAAVPESVGGAGHGLLEQCVVLVELGRAAAHVPYLETVVLGASALAAFGSAAQRDAWAAPAARGDLVITVAVDASASLHASATLDAGRLTGSASAVPHGAAADVILVPVAPGAVVVTPSDDGVLIEPQNVGGFDRAALTFDAAPIGPDRVLADVSLARWLRDRAVVGHCAHQAGVVERALELTAAYAAGRVQFGRPIGAFQAVRQRLAEAYIDVEATRLSLWQAAWRLSEGLPCAEEIAVAKFWAADAGHRVAHTAVHLHGGVGVDVSHPVHRYFLAAEDNEFVLGGATAHLLALGELLAAGEAAGASAGGSA